MKTAVLPTGEAVHFPDETPDEHIHAQVRQKMGLPPPEPAMDPAVEALGQHAQAVNGAQVSNERLTQSTAALHQQIGALMQALDRTTQALAHVNQTTVHAVVEATGGVARAVDRIAQVAEQMRTATDQSAATVDRTKSAIGSLADKFEQSAQKVVDAVNAPKRAVKDKDGWTTVPL